MSDIKFSKTPKSMEGNNEVYMVASSSQKIIIQVGEKGKEKDKSVPAELTKGRFYKVNSTTLARIKKQSISVSAYQKATKKGLKSRD